MGFPTCDGGNRAFLLYYMELGHSCFQPPAEGEVVTEEGFGLADVVVDFGKAVMGSFPYPSKARQGFHLCSARTLPTAPPNPVRGSPSVAVGDAAAPTTP